MNSMELMLQKYDTVITFHSFLPQVVFIILP